MKVVWLLLIITSTVLSQEAIKVAFCWETRCYESSVNTSDTTSFNIAVAEDSFPKAISFLQGYTKITEDTHLAAEGMYTRGKRVDKWQIYQSSPPFELYEIKFYNDQSVCIKTEYYENGVLAKTENTLAKKHREKLVEDYRLGIQIPTILDGAYPTGLTLSSLNFHCDIPSVKNWSFGDYSRPQFVVASEAGLRGGAVRVGLSPFMKDQWSNTYFHFTPLTFNGSMTYLWNARDEYKRLEPLENKRWYAGADVDFSYIFGHVRFGAFRMVGPESDRPWRFMFSVGVTPGLLFFPAFIPFAG